MSKTPIYRGNTQSDDTWRVFKIISEFVDGFEKLSKIGKAISVFGSARIKEGDPNYEAARAIGHEIAKAGFKVITGGGPGVMEAAARGGKEAGGETIGLNIKLPKEQGNIYSDLKIDFNYFFCRKVMFKKYSNGIIVCPGGFGTMDEMFEVLTLIQTRKAKWSPVVLYDTEYWKDLFVFIEKHLLKRGYINKSDLKLIKMTDDPKEAVKIISDVYKSSEEARTSLIDLED
jgi:uncharacterized protein (TIGR00730 family)